MTHTRDFEVLLELENVVGVEYDERDDRVVAFVTKKVPESELDPDHVVQRNVEKDSAVEELGELTPLTAESEDELPAAHGMRQDRHRPVEGGVSEANANITAGTAGLYPAKVVDITAADWDNSVSEGERVRLSNNHVYARANEAALGESILQPSPYDGGDESDSVGKLAGYVPIENGTSVDVAARSVETEQEATTYHDLDDTYPTGVYRKNAGDLLGEAVVKTGRTTGVTAGEVKATSATVTVQYGGDLGAVTLRDQLITSRISEGGDSGSPVFLESSGELLAELFAGSAKASVLCKATNIEAELGVKLMADDQDESTYVESFDETVSIEMEGQDLELDGLRGDKPKAGEAIEATATVSGNYGGECWLAVQGERYTFTLDDEENGSHTADVPVTVTSPDRHQQSFEVGISGGYVE
ncbi:chymotrypsin family serine protease [Halorussus halophilus]|uniref:hypothetical protein n=1 Tax=Halorussus halophilus TaxID=2650975 RepID=UPI0013016361|nr:hypothetical protein [Halorussus halophilus]